MTMTYNVTLKNLLLDQLHHLFVAVIDRTMNLYDYLHFQRSNLYRSSCFYPRDGRLDQVTKAQNEEKIVAE
jgi:hypothetical protein